ncbi:hypothetical protein [Nocardia bovistercoris]|uniref:Uncharacterized protein n=1 Tax=Nocardia bovistercoris TaxID=2785916 RepID=A0A931N532_9NOCA|nr:hypothetical protein [Nocardia bovistercoris]MBH0779332.1 hypothetical protein [Nocardia bovistercoris]
MTGTLIDVPAHREIPVERELIARPAPRGYHRMRTPAREPSPVTALWREARTVLAARPVVGPRKLVTVPRLVVPVGAGQLAFSVSSRSAEADQFATDERVLVQPGDWRGSPVLGSRQREGHAQLVTAGTLLPYVRSELDAKYRWRIPLARLAHRLARRDEPFGDAVILVTVHDSDSLPFAPPRP